MLSNVIVLPDKDVKFSKLLISIPVIDQVNGKLVDKILCPVTTKFVIIP
jgi:hypothetical protein